MIAAAGTGGHIYPGLSIAEYFYKNKYKISWVGTHHGMENKHVNKSLYNFSIAGDTLNFSTYLNSSFFKVFYLTAIGTSDINKIVIEFLIFCFLNANVTAKDSWKLALAIVMAFNSIS